MTSRMLQPYGLVAKAGTWYLVAERDTVMRTYRVSRCRSASVLDITFQRRPDFDLQTFWTTHAQTFFESLLQYRYTLQVRCQALDMLRRYHTGRYTISASTSDAAWVLVHLEAEVIEPATMLVFGLGEDCRVVDSPDLMAAVVRRSTMLMALPQSVQEES